MNSEESLQDALLGKEIVSAELISTPDEVHYGVGGEYLQLILEDGFKIALPFNDVLMEWIPCADTE